MTARRYTLNGRLGALTVRGAALKADVAEAVTRASLDLSLGEIPQLDLTLHDPDLKLLDARLFVPGSPTTAGTPLDYGRLRLECRAVTVNEGSTLTVVARDLGAYKLKRLRATPRRNMSHTDAIALDARAAGVRFLGEPSPRRSTIAGDAANAWEQHAEHARDLGYLRFLSGGTLYFGRVSWLLKLAQTPGGHRRLAWSGDGKRADPQLLARPICRRSGDDDRGDASVTARIAGPAGDRFEPGNIASLTGVPTFDGLYVIDKVRLELDDYSPVTVSGITPRNPLPAPRTATPAVTTPAGTPRAAQSTPVATGSGTADAMVRFALEQAGDRYIFGAEANLNDPDPDAFDCSELVEWACARAGVRFVDGSSNQRARVRPIPVEQAKRTRGALLFHPGHVAISLGDGRTIEASNRRYPVRVTGAGSRFTYAGLIPGLRYA